MTPRLALVAPILIALFRGCSAPPPIAKAAAEAFRQSVGVNLHLEYDGTPYAVAGRTPAALAFVRLHHVRDAAMRSGPDREDRFRALAAQGAVFDLFVNRDLDAQIAAAQRLQQSRAGAVALIEGPNEANHEAFGDSAAGNVGALQAYQRGLYAATRSTPELRRLPVAAFTTWPPVSAAADWANFHAYPDVRRKIAPQLRWMRTMAAALQPQGQPVVCTETGFPTAGSDALAETDQASATLEVLLENFRARVVRTYLYELFDEHPAGPGSADREGRFGLFRYDGSAKPSAVALQRLMDSLVARGAPTRYAPAPTGGGLRTLELARADGSRLTLSWWTQAELRGGDLTFATPPGAEVEVLDLVTGEDRRFGPGRHRLAVSPYPLAWTWGSTLHRSATASSSVEALRAQVNRAA